jgi:hypothetical protein
LCQGATLHYVSGENGINDFDVGTFYERAKDIPDLPCRRYPHYDFGESKFGKHPADEQYAGRYVDALGRSIHVAAGKSRRKHFKNIWLKGERNRHGI